MRNMLGSGFQGLLSVAALNGPKHRHLDAMSHLRARQKLEKLGAPEASTFRSICPYAFSDFACITRILYSMDVAHVFKQSWGKLVRL